MKKQIMFYILWDVLFFAFLCGFGKISSMLKLYVGRTMNAFPSFFVSLGLLMLLGGIFFLLVTVSSGFQRTAQTAAAEFLLVGLPALYIATAFSSLIYYLKQAWGRFGSTFRLGFTAVRRQWKSEAFSSAMNYSV